MNKRNISLDALKGLTIILVMFGHVLVWNKIEDAYFYNMIKAVQMPLFMVVSGYVSGMKRPVNGIYEAMSLIIRRATAYLLPFFSWLILKYWRDLGWGLKNVLFNLDRGLWFLMTLFILTFMLIMAQLISGYLSDFLASEMKNKAAQSDENDLISIKREAIFWIIYIMLVLLIIIQNRSGNTFLSPSLTIYYMPFFMGGYFVKRYEGIIKRYFKIFLDKRIISFLIILSGILWIVISLKYNFSVNSDIITVLMQMAAGAFGSFAIAGIFLNTKENKIKMHLAWIGRYTLEIYVLHFHFATILNTGREYPVWYTPQGMVFTLLSFIAMSAITALIIWIIKKYIPLLDALLFGKVGGLNLKCHSKR